MLMKLSSAVLRRLILTHYTSDRCVIRGSCVPMDLSSRLAMQVPVFHIFPTPPLPSYELKTLRIWRIPGSDCG